MKQFDVVIVGGGTAGITAALAARSTGVRLRWLSVRRVSAATAPLWVRAVEGAARDREGCFRRTRSGVREHLAEAPTIDFAQVTARQRRVLEEIAADERDERFRLETLGITLDCHYVRIDARGRTSVANIFAAGDVTGGLQFTHVAAHEGRVAGLNAAGKRAQIDEGSRRG